MNNLEQLSIGSWFRLIRLPFPLDWVEEAKQMQDSFVAYVQLENLKSYFFFAVCIPIYLVESLFTVRSLIQSPFLCFYRFNYQVLSNHGIFCCFCFICKCRTHTHTHNTPQSRQSVVWNPLQNLENVKLCITSKIIIFLTWNPECGYGHTCDVHNICVGCRCTRLYLSGLS